MFDMEKAIAGMRWIGWQRLRDELSWKRRWRGACHRNLVDAGGRFLCPKGTASPARGEAAVEGTSETRSHAIGQYRIREPCYGEAGVTLSAFIAASVAGLLRSTSVNCATAVGQDIPLPTPAFSKMLSASIDAFRSRPLDLQHLASVKGGARKGLAMCVA